NSGTVVGTASTSQGSRAFVYSESFGLVDLNKVTTLWTSDNPRPLAFTEAVAVNDIGQIVCTGTLPTGESRAYLFTPFVSGPPEITKHPQSQVIVPGGSATLSVSATGQNLAYEWKRNGDLIAGANSPPLTATTVGSYTVYVRNPLDTV